MSDSNKPIDRPAAERRDVPGSGSSQSDGAPRSAASRLVPGVSDQLATVIHATAVVEPGAQLGVGVEVGPYAVIGSHVVIGDRTTVGPHAVIDGWTAIGDDCQIHASVVLGTEPQDLKFAGGQSFVEIGNNNIIREFVTINRATGEDELTVVGDHNLIMAYVHIAHNCVIGSHVILANAVNLAGHVEIDDFAIVGGVTCVHQFVRIGSHAFVGGGSRVPQDVPPYIRCAGNPMRVGGLNSVGLKRRDFSPAVLSGLKRAYRLVYRADLNVSQALARIRADGQLPAEVGAFVEFIAGSERGIVK